MENNNSAKEKRRVAKDSRTLFFIREEWPSADERIQINHHMYVSSTRSTYVPYVNVIFECNVMQWNAMQCTLW